MHLAKLCSDVNARYLQYGTPEGVIERCWPSTFSLNPGGEVHVCVKEWNIGLFNLEGCFLPSCTATCVGYGNNNGTANGEHCGSNSCRLGLCSRVFETHKVVRAVQHTTVGRSYKVTLPLQRRRCHRVCAEQDLMVSFCDGSIGLYTVHTGCDVQVYRLYHHRYRTADIECLYPIYSSTCMAD